MYLVSETYWMLLEIHISWFHSLVCVEFHCKVCFDFVYQKFPNAFPERTSLNAVSVDYSNPLLLWIPRIQCLRYSQPLLCYSLSALRFCIIRKYQIVVLIETSFMLFSPFVNSDISIVNHSPFPCEIKDEWEIISKIKHFVWFDVIRKIQITALKETSFMLLFTL